ncbi:MAG: hypothetical protein LCH88_05355 [Proteobacteria bacterium]|nr:hypothetical protein [Pseudomonadota bacterium]
MRALTIEEAMRARRILDGWLDDNGKPLEPIEEHAVDTVLRSPVGSRAGHNLALVVWLLRDMTRLANQRQMSSLTELEAETVIEKMEDARSARGEPSVGARKETWQALLRSAIGTAAAADTDRLDAVVSELMAITARKPKERAA